MPDIRTTIEQDTEADRKSKPYRTHPHVTVRQFLKMNWQDQRRIDAECESLAALEKTTVKPLDGPAYVVGTKPKSPH
jgi:hypothetical protein